MDMGSRTAYVEAFSFKVDCFYIKEEAEQIRERITSAGGAALTSDQRHALEAVLRCTPLWSVRHELLDIYGLPREREALEILMRKGGSQ